MIDSVGHGPDAEGPGRRKESATDRATLRYMSVEEPDEDRSLVSFGQVDETFHRMERRTPGQLRVVCAKRFDRRRRDPFSKIPELTWPKPNALRETPRESAETVVAHFERDVRDAAVSIQ